MRDRLSGVLTFVQAADAGSFALAAQRLSVSRSAVGKSIARLEQRLGTRLFHRTTRNQTLTDDGQAFYERCVRALAEIEEAEAALDSGRRAPTGRLRVSMPVLFGRYCAAPVLLDMARRYPQLQLDLSFTDRVVDLVDENFDLAVRIAPLASRTGLIGRRLGTMSVLVCASPEYLAARGTPATIADLDAHDTLIYARRASVASWFFLDGNGQREQVQIKSRLRFDDLEAIADAAVAGAGITWLPSVLVTKYLREGRLVELPLGKRRFGVDAYAVWPQTRHPPSKVRVAVDDLADRVPGILAAAQARERSVARGSPQGASR
jgi:DNA-binding transcriptional LysR family regulator